jgi:4'-phosphopantetheinyl transferase
MTTPETLHPAIMAVPGPEQKLKGKEKVSALKLAARQALHLSASYSGVELGPLKKADTGAPLPSKGIYWSLTHKSQYVAAVVAMHPIGIDIEKDRPISDGLYERIAAPREWALAATVTRALFYRYWTAKEAVLKAVGKGLTGLTRCHIVKIVDDAHLELTYDGTIWQVAQRWFPEDHIVSVTVDGNDIIWHQPD